MTQDIVIKELVMSKINSKQELVTIPSLQKSLESEKGVTISRLKLLKIVKMELGLVWKPARSKPPYVNRVNNVLLRQAFAAKLLDTISASKKILSFDESAV